MQLNGRASFLTRVKPLAGCLGGNCNKLLVVEVAIGSTEHETLWTKSINPTATSMGAQDTEALRFETEGEGDYGVPEGFGRAEKGRRSSSYRSP